MIGFYDDNEAKLHFYLYAVFACIVGAVGGLVYMSIL